MTQVINNLSNINHQKNVFKVIRENAKRQDSVNGPTEDIYKFISKVSKVAYLLNSFIK